jgi:hypothetical protein
MMKVQIAFFLMVLLIVSCKDDRIVSVDGHSCQVVNLAVGNVYVFHYNSTDGETATDDWSTEMITDCVTLDSLVWYFTDADNYMRTDCGKLFMREGGGGIEEELNYDLSTGDTFRYRGLQLVIQKIEQEQIFSRRETVYVATSGNGIDTVYYLKYATYFGVITRQQKQGSMYNGDYIRAARICGKIYGDSSLINLGM